MGTPTRRLTRSFTKNESPEHGKKSKSKKNFICVDTPTPNKVTNPDQNRYGVNIGHRRRIRSCSANGSPQNQNISKGTSEKAAQNFSSKKLKEPHVSKPWDELKGYGEKLNKIMMDIRLRQDQIISHQIDLKYELRAMQRIVDEKINGFVDELRVKLSGKSSSHVSSSPIVIYNDSIKMKTKDI
ncbi:hypothetical protein Fot_10763 [Forsythia ovata]|uniref:Uncharacterized protein n=1 Tax=Forsythia ovata TaxID=205694 RepID=A0ABD1WKE3_9LAMI